MYERTIASPTTARIDRVACTSCKSINAEIEGKLTHQAYQHRCEVLGKALLVLGSRRKIQALIAKTDLPHRLIAYPRLFAGAPAGNVLGNTQRPLRMYLVGRRMM
jgi:hypothetical protein